MKISGISVILLAICLCSCKKDEPAVLEEIAIESIKVTDVEINSATIIVGMKNFTGTEARGIQYGTSLNQLNKEQLIQNGLTVCLNTLSANTTYYARAFVISNGVTSYSETISFWTYALEYDGSFYHTVDVGGNTWTVENLKATHYRNGDAIEAGQTNLSWITLLHGAYCSYNNDDGLVKTYGRLYNYLAISDERNIAPLGWHIPSMEEWGPLFKLKAEDLMSVNYWESELIHPTNETNFNALPAGRFYASTYSSTNGYKFDLLGKATYFASSSFYSDAAGFTYWMISPTLDGRNNRLLEAHLDCKTQNPSGQSGCAISIRLVKDQ